MTLTKKLQYVIATSFRKVTRNKRNIPNAAIGIAFKSKYPKATFVQWNQIGVFKWQVAFHSSGKDFLALFDADGTWFETVTLLDLDSTPKQVRESFVGKYGADGLQQIHFVKTPYRDIFEIQWSNGVFVRKLLYDISGKVIGKMIG